MELNSAKIKVQVKVKVKSKSDRKIKVIEIVKNLKIVKYDI